MKNNFHGVKKREEKLIEKMYKRFLKNSLSYIFCKTRIK